MKNRNISVPLILLATSLGTGRPCLAAEGTAATTTTTATPSSLTLDEAMRLTREHNPRALQATDEVKAASARVTQARSAWFPQISAKAGYQYIDPVSEISFGGVPMKFMPNDNYDARITAEMLLFDFGRSGRTVDMAKSGREAATHKRDMTLRDLSLATVRSFYSVLFLQEAVKVKDKEIAALQQNLDHMQKRYQEGVATRYDLLTTQVRLADANNRKIDLQTELDNQRINLRRLCGLTESSTLDLKGSFDITRTDMDATRLAANALEQRPEIMIARENHKAATYRKSLSAKEGLPKIVGSASWGTTNGYQPDINEMRTNVAAGVQLQVPIFTGFRTSASTKEASAMMHAAEQERIDTEEMVRAEVRQSINDLKTSEEKIGTTTLQVSQADLAAKHARIRYQNGLGTTLDLLDAEARLANAELANLQARYEYVLNAYAVRRASGDLIEK
ncbi:MAG: TolC family protein [Chlorobiaceae bacterium]|nr:TolC family protein [Chlorobiaceae bacterium]NTV26229.1 TolC family protein [Chlorobiaceae bacterium]